MHKIKQQRTSDGDKYHEEEKKKQAIELECEEESGLWTRKKKYSKWVSKEGQFEGLTAEQSHMY